MSRAILSRIPRLAAAATRPGAHTFSAHRPAASRFFSTTPPPPPNVEGNAASAAMPVLPLEPPMKAPEILTAAPPDPEALTAAADAAASAAAEVAAAGTITPLSDTLLQPALTLLNTVHDITGLPWWLAIGASTLAIRSLLLPVTLMTMRNSARMTALKGDIEEKRGAVMDAVRAGDKPLAAVRQKEMQDFMSTAGVTPLKVLAGPLVQFPVFISFFVGLRRLSQADPTFVTGGAMWFVDLAAKDPTFLLPVLCGMSLVTMTELGGDTGTTKMSKEMRMGMRAVAVLSVPMTYWFPSAVFCYWIPNNIFSIGLGAALRTKPSRQMLGLNVDVSKIPGTKAAKQLAAKLAAGGKGTRAAVGMDPAAAIASYAKSSSTTPNMQSVKPVLLKQRPTKKNMKTSVN